MRVVVAFNRPKTTQSEGHWLQKSLADRAVQELTYRDAAECGNLEVVPRIAAAIRNAGHETSILEIGDPMQLMTCLKDEKPQAIFNCVEAFAGVSALEAAVAGIYELYGVPYTGSGAQALGLTLNKSLSKDVMRAHGIPTPASWLILDLGALKGPGALDFPLIVKPNAEDASIGIDAGAVVHTWPELERRVAFVLQEFRQPALVEEFIDGRDLSVSLLWQSQSVIVSLPVSEIVFELPDGMPRIVGYEAKWIESSPLYAGTPPRCPASLDPVLQKRISDIAINVAQVLGLRDYARIDFRLRGSDGRAFVLEANPNPDLSEDAGFMRAARASGRTGDETIVEILNRAIERSAS